MSTAKIEDIYPLSPMQEGLLFQSLFAPDSRAYFLQTSATLHGNLQPTAYKQAWQHVVARHAALRSTFSWERRETPIQIVLRQLALPWQELDWRALPAEEQQRQLADYLAAEQRRGFHLAKAPLLRLTLIRLADQQHQFIISTHHMLLDGWAFALMMQEVIDIYETLAADRPVTLAPVRPYRDYIAWLQQQDQAAAQRFWQQTLAGFSAPNQLSIDRSPGAQPSQRPDRGHQQLRLSAELTARLHALARAHQLTLNTVIQGAWSLVLHRASGDNDVVFGITVSGRPATLDGSESMIGLFINTLPLRIRLPLGERLAAWLQQVQRAQLEARQYEHSALGQVQRWSDIAPGANLFESVLIYQNFPAQAGWSPDSTIRVTAGQDVEGTHYPLSLVVKPGQELTFVLGYERTRFGDDDVRALLEYLQHTLARLADDPQQRLADLPLLTAAEREELITSRNQTAVAMPELCYHQLVAAQAARTPDAVALIDGERTLTYHELLTRATQLAQHLRASGVRPGDCVCICMERSLEMVVGLLGVMLSGAAFLPFDPSFPTSRMAFMLEDTRASIILTQQHLAERLPQPATLVLLDSDWPSIAQSADPRAALPSIDADHLAYVIYTSGSTGKPKGVPVPHRGLVNYLVWAIDAYGPAHGAGAPVQSSIAADAIFPSLFTPLIVGTTVLILPEEQALSALAQALQQPVGFSMIKITPTQLEVLNQLLPPSDASGWVRTLVVGAEAVRGDVLTYWQRHAPATVLLNEYGPTETVVGCSIYQVPAGLTITGAVPIGRPIANLRFYVLDHWLRPVAVGVPGELYIGGVGVAWGYLNRPALTATAFVPDPFSAEPGARLYKTGDMVRSLPDAAANIEFLGRLDDQVKIRGYRVELAEVEAALVEHPGVSEVAVLAREDSSGQKRLIAYLVPTDARWREALRQPADDEAISSTAATFSTADLRQLLQATLPDYMIPSAFVLLPALPLTPHGKLNRQALPLPERANTEAAAELVAPRNLREQQLVEMWQELLHIQPIGVTDNFFALGGNSLLAIRMVAQMQQRLGVEFTLPALFANPTIAQISALLDDQSYPGVLKHFDAISEMASPLVAIRPGGSSRPFFLAAPLGGILPATILVGVLDLAHYLDREQPYYGLQLPPLANDLARRMRVEQSMDDAQVREILQQAPSGNQVLAAMAEQCVSAIRRVQPQGPYLIGGFCSGSFVAYETARLLRAQGHAVAALVLIDEEAPSERVTTPFAFHEPEDPAAHIAWFACRDLASDKIPLLKKDVPGVAADLRALPDAARWSYVRDLLAEIGAAAADTEPHEIQRLYQIYRTNQDSLRYVLRSYAPPAYPGQITLIRASDASFALSDPSLGWSRLAEDGIDLHYTPGDHGTLFLSPNVEVLTTLLTKLLATAQALPADETLLLSARAIGDADTKERS